MSLYNPPGSLYSNKRLWRSSERNYPLFSFSLFLCLFLFAVFLYIYLSNPFVRSPIPFPTLYFLLLFSLSTPLLAHPFLTLFCMSVNIFTIFLTLPFFSVFFFSLSFIWSSSCHELARRSNKPTLEKYLSKYSTMF